MANGWQYIEGRLAETLGLSKKIKDPTYFTLEHFVRMYEYLWRNDCYDYRHEGSRVDISTLLNAHCYTSARLAEVCQAEYKVKARSKRNNS